MSNFFSGLDVGRILGFGVIGLGLLLAVLAANVILKTEIKNDRQLKASYAFLIFAFGLINAGIVQEYMKYVFDDKIKSLQSENAALLKEQGALNGQIESLRQVISSRNNSLSGKVQQIRGNMTTLDEKITGCWRDAAGASTNTNDAGGCTKAASAASESGNAARALAAQVMGTLDSLLPAQ